ncbi:MAG TPA: SCO6880 family protein [Acidimicrobiales bacterium]|nr:SCO6880 family protein [Acidimicrobiales bacterium]
MVREPRDGDGRQRYRFGPLERRGLIAGWRGGQIGVVAAALVLAVAALRSLPTVPGLAVALGTIAGAVGIATWPFGGRTVEQWTPDAVRFALGARSVPWRHPLAPFAHLHVLEPSVCGEGGATTSVGVLHDRAARTYTAVIAASGAGFVLSGRADQAARVDSWSASLASLARQGGLVHRLQWVERSLPDGGAEVRHHYALRGAHGADTSATRSYAGLLDAEAVVSQRHEVLLSVTVHAGHSARAVRAAGGGDLGACTVLLREVTTLRRRLGEAGVRTGPALDGHALAGAVRRGFDAEVRTSASAASPWPPAPSHEHRPWPMAIAPEWGRVRVDGTWHATYWVAEWPRTEVGADFLAPLLLLSDVRRTVSLVMEPVDPLQAARRVEQARTADIADAELRGRGGFLATARRRREEEVLALRETELADGHAQYRFTGYVTVSAEDETSLDDACSQAELAAARAGLELRRCYGDQVRAFVCSLPLGRGLA